MHETFDQAHDQAVYGRSANERQIAETGGRTFPCETVGDHPGIWVTWSELQELQEDDR
jgi:hypothetical protein